MLSCRVVSSRNLVIFSIAMAATAAGCATSGNPQVRARARQHVLAGKSCPEKQIVYEDPDELAFVLSGCGRVARIALLCDSGECINRSVSGTTWAQPRRLLTTDQKVWQAPGFVFPPPKPAQPQKPLTANIGKRLTSMDEAAFAPSLPRELRRSGFTAWGLFKVCVDTAGSVIGVEVLKSALPGGLDGDWIAKIEGWRYAPYMIDGRPVSFCTPVRLQVTAG
jgi:hypothetical protein